MSIVHHQSNVMVKLQQEKNKQGGKDCLLGKASFLTFASRKRTFVEGG